MDALKQAPADLEAFVARLADQSPTLEPMLLLAVLVLLCLLALASMRFAAALGAILLAATGYYIGAAAKSAPLAPWLCASAGSLIVSLAGMSSRRREKARRRELETLRLSIQTLESAAQRQVLQSLNPHTREIAEKERAERP